MQRTIIYLVRHGQTVHNRDYIVSGQVNPPLTPQGIIQAQEVSKKLNAIKFDHVYTSDLERAIHTAEIIIGSKVLDNHKLHGLRERSFGSLDGKPEVLLDELARAKRPQFNELSDVGQWRFKYAPDIESDYELSKRFVRTLEDVAKRHPGQKVLIVAHGGAMRTTIIRLQGLKTNAYPKGSLKNGSVVVLAYNGSTLEVQALDVE